MKYRVVVMGSQPAALVSASELQAAGEDFIWLKGPAPGGGIFRGIHFAGRDWDAGMNLLEFTALKDSTPGELTSYSPKVRYDYVRFLPQIRAWLEKRIQIKQVPTPEMYFRGQALPDFLISNHSAFFQKLPEEIRSEIFAFVSRVSSSNPLHARFKHENPTSFESVSYREVAYANHGVWLQQNLIEPWLEKITSGDGLQIPALFHRQAWAPLFYPETLQRFLQDPAYQLPPTIFEYPQGEGFGAWMQREEADLKDKLDTSNWKSISRTPSGWTIHTEHNSYECQHLAYTGDLSQFLELSGRKQGNTLRRGKLGFIGIYLNQKDLLKETSVLNVPEKDFALFRLMDQTLCAGLDSESHFILGEFAQSVPEESEVRKIMEESGWIREGSEIKIAGSLGPVSAFVMPEFENLRIFRNLQEEMESHFPNLIRMGSAGEMTSVSLNDQIVQGLQLPHSI
jgi:hypothetical protein